MIIFKIILYKRLLRIHIDINNNKPTPYQSLLILFLIIDFSCAWENNSIYSTQRIHCKLSRLIVYILIIYCCLNVVNISTSNNYNIYKQWKGIISKSILFYIQYTIKLAWIWLLCLFTINNYRWPAALSCIKGSKTLIN